MRGREKRAWRTTARHSARDKKLEWRLDGRGRWPFSVTAGQAGTAPIFLAWL
jgi:hypothetical protein